MSKVTQSPEVEPRFVRELDVDECLRLLATQSLGRFAVSEGGAAPHVVPVNYMLHNGEIVFRSGDGTKLRLLQSEPVSFQVDCADPYHQIGWSVLVRGRALQADPVEADQFWVEAFAPGDKPHWIRLVPETMTGRRIHLPVLPAHDPRGYL